jgi:ankyrin repeat protein
VFARFPRLQYRNTPLHAACEAGKLDVVRLLLQRGADPEAVNMVRWLRAGERR